MRKKFYDHSHLPVIQEGQLSVTGERIGTQLLVNCLVGMPRNSVARLTDHARNDLNVSKGRNTPIQQTNFLKSKKWILIKLDDLYNLNGKILIDFGYLEPILKGHHITLSGKD